MRHKKVILEIKIEFEEGSNSSKLLKSLMATTADLGQMFEEAVDAFKTIVVDRNRSVENMTTDGNASSKALVALKRVVDAESKKNVKRKRQQRQRELLNGTTKIQSLQMNFMSVIQILFLYASLYDLLVVHTFLQLSSQRNTY